MKRVLICIRAGRAEVEYADDGVEVIIVDWDWIRDYNIAQIQELLIELKEHPNTKSKQKLNELFVKKVTGPEEKNKK